MEKRRIKLIGTKRAGNVTTKLLSLIFTLLLSLFCSEQDVWAVEGDLNSSLSGSGTATLALSNPQGANAMVIQSDGKIIVGGSSAVPNGTNIGFAMARYNANGSLDTTFGTNGKVHTMFNGHGDKINALAIQADGKIVAGGSVSLDSTGNTAFGLARYNTNGSLDTSFDVDGKVTTNFFPKKDEINALAIQADGKIVAAGSVHAFTSTGSDHLMFGLARYNTNGSLDTSFSGDGKQITRVDVSCACKISSAAYDVAIQADGRIVAAGYTHLGLSTSTAFAVVRYNSNGTLDDNETNNTNAANETDSTPGDSFGLNGAVITQIGDVGSAGQNVARALKIKKESNEEKILVAGVAPLSGAKAVALSQYNLDGSLDAGFGNGGTTITFDGREMEAHDLALRADGMVMVAGSVANSNNAKTDFALLRYQQNGSLDYSFGINGVAVTDFADGNYNDQAKAVGFESNGMVLVAGGFSNATQSGFALARYFGPEHEQDAQFITQSVPLTMNAGKTYNVTVTMKNTGAKTWSVFNNPNNLQGYRLGSESPRDNMTWNKARVNLTAPVKPYENVTFSYVITAPSTAGTYDFQWQMMQEFVGWFGEKTVNVPVEVTKNDAVCITQSLPEVPTTVAPDQTFNVSIKCTNTGSTTWTVWNGSAGYRLYPLPDSPTPVWGVGRVNLTAPVYSTAGSNEVIFNFTVTAPSTPGTYNFKWGMLQEFVEYFGAPTENTQITVE